MSSDRAPRAGGWLLALTMAIAVVYLNSLSAPFVFDDDFAIVENPTIRNLGDIGRVLSPERNSPVAGRPLVNLTFAVNYAVGGLEVTGYRIANLAIHMGVALLLFGLVRRTLELMHARAAREARGERPDVGFLHTHRMLCAWAVALVWAVHPLASEPVDYVTQRTESLMALGYLATLYAAVRAAGTTSGRDLGWEAAAAVACVGGVLCKESMVTVPLVVMLYDWVFAFDSLGAAARARGRLYAMLLGSWVLVGWIMWTAPRGNSVGFATGTGAVTYLLNQAEIVTRYLYLSVWPRALVINYGWPRAVTLQDVAVSGVFLLTIVCVAMGTAIRRSAFGFLGACVFIMLAPTSTIIPIATEVGAERRMYLPLMAIVALAVMGLPLLLRRLRPAWSQRFTPATALLLVAVLSVPLAARTVARNREYASDLTLAQVTLERWPTSVSHFMVGATLARAGRHEDAEPHLREAARGVPTAHYTLGSELFDRGRIDEAIVELETFLREAPQRFEAIPARGLLGQAYGRQERWSQAVEQFQMLTRMAPADTEAKLLLAGALLSAQRFDEAAAEYRNYVRLQPADWNGFNGLAIAYIGLGRPEEAIAAFRQAAEAAPDNAAAHRNLANALFDHRQIEDAARHAERAVALAPSDAAAHELLGRVLAVLGRLDEAREHVERALAIDPGYQEAREDLRRLDALGLRSP